MSLKTPKKEILKNIQMKIDGDHAGQRLDVFLACSVQGISRSRAKALVNEGFVLVNGMQAKVSRILSEGDLINVSVPMPSVPSAVPQKLPLEIIYEDSDIIVINKPAGMVVHPAAGHERDTLVNALLYHCKDLSGIGGELKPGIVHRLDLGTSGVIVAAKNDDAHRSLAHQFKARTVGKIYLALVYGAMREDSGKCDSPIGRSVRDRKKMSGHTRKGRVALTEWNVLRRFGKGLSWVLIRLRTGRMHQIRVHFSESHHPLVGDSLYGGKRKLGRLFGGELDDYIKNFSRPALHAWRIEIMHPKTGKRMEFEAELPNDLKLLLSKFEKSQKLL